MSAIDHIITQAMLPADRERIMREAARDEIRQLRADSAAKDRYAEDWRKVCNALNTSPDSNVDMLLKKIAVLQDAARAALP